MHSQLLTPDSATPFNSKQDVLARLLPYHVYAESEPPPAAVEKGVCVCVFQCITYQKEYYYDGTTFWHLIQ